MTKHLACILIALLIGAVHGITSAPLPIAVEQPLSAEQDVRKSTTVSTPQMETVEVKAEEVTEEPIKPSRGGSTGRYMEITAYTGSPDEGGEITSTGKPVRKGMCASGPEYPFGTILYVEGIGEVVVEDRGVSNGHLDIAVDSKKEAYKIGRSIKKVYVVYSPVR